LGEELKINFLFDLFQEKYKVRYSNSVLHISGKKQNDEIINHIYNVFIKHSAKKYLLPRANSLARQFNFPLKKISIRGQSTRWGSCSRRGTISLNYKLMKFKKEVIDYVIIHELCHLKEMNHSKRFWDEVEKIIPEYRLLRKELKEAERIN